nr:zinc knuckle CX2CX4HX4C [Tanacetum cinerariifolium]
MHDEFEMSMIGELNFFLGLQIKQMEDEIFFKQSKYIKEMLKKLGLEDCKPTNMPMSTKIKLTKNDEADSVDSTNIEGVSLVGTHNAIKEPSRAMSTGHGIVYSVSDISNLNLVLINGIFDFFKVSLLTPVDIDNFIRDLDSDKFKGWSSFARCLTEVNSEADIVHVVTIGIPSLTGEDFTKETIKVEYEWRPPRYELKTILQMNVRFLAMSMINALKRMVSPSIATTFNVVTFDVTPTVVMSNDGFQTVGKKKKKGKAKSTNVSQFVCPSVKQNFRYEPKAATSQPKKGATNVGNASKSSPKLKSTNTSSKEGNIATSNFYSALENDKDEEHVKNVHDELANLFLTLKANERSSFTVGVG